MKLDQAVENEDKRISHFEVYICMNEVFNNIVDSSKVQGGSAI